MDVEDIIRCIKEGDEDGIRVQLLHFNREFAQCFFYDTEEQERRRHLTAVLSHYIRSEPPGRILRACLLALRILSRDKKILGPLVTDDSLLTLAKLGGVSSGEEEEEEEEDGVAEDMQRKEAMKVLCNVVYNSVWAQERASELRLLSGVTDALGMEAKSLSPHCGQFYELRLMFLLTALRAELRIQLKQEGGLPLLINLLEQCLGVQWVDEQHVLRDPTAPPVPMEATQRAMETLKILFNITYSAHTQIPSEDDMVLYRQLAAMLGHCLMMDCEGGEKETDDLKGHTINLLSALPLGCLEVLVSAPLTPDSVEWEGVNMDYVHALLCYMERKLEKGLKMKEKLTPALNFLTECSRAHRQTRRYLRQQVLPALKDVSLRPEHGDTLKSRLVRLMTHVDTELKHCAADFLFVLCKENVGRFVKYTGYGNAAGLLATRGLLGGQSMMCCAASAHYSDDSDSDTEEYRRARGRVNLVTGRVEEEQPDPMAGMTEEEKEVEARRLVSLFSRLSRENVIQPMGLNAQGHLTPMGALMSDPMAEENEENGAGGDDLEEVE
ncbi:synembryn-A [Engraulis encrasicolus]|uniref:synembryn-A n=1 Tax=Engraulis encrasicolus TaxID=184585 RepID=UPI002FD771FA